MKRLNAILMNNNYVSRVAANLGENLPELTSLILTNNRIQNLSEIDSIATLKKLEILSLLENTVNTKTNYRVYTIYRIPTLKWLDFRKVTKTERDEVARYFKSPPGKSFLAAIELEGRQIAETGNAAVAARGNAVTQLTDAQKLVVKAAIEKATTKEEIDHIERQLKVRLLMLFRRISATYDDLFVIGVLLLKFLCFSLHASCVTLFSLLLMLCSDGNIRLRGRGGKWENDC